MAKPIIIVITEKSLMGFAALYPSYGLLRRAKHSAIPKTCQALAAKKFHCAEIRIYGISRNTPAQGKGRSYVVTVVGWDCGGRRRRRRGCEAQGGAVD